MLSRKLLIAFIPLGFILVMSLVWFGSVANVNAQCGVSSSSCKTCHETQSQKPVNASGDWHIQHAQNDFCVNCHGGDQAAVDKTAAHARQLLNLADMQGNCATCHPDDLQAKFSIYAGALGVSSAGSANTKDQSTKDPLTNFLGVDAADVSATTPTTAPLQTPTSPNTTGNLILIAIIALVLIGGGSYIYWNERRPHPTPTTRELVEDLPAPDLPGIPNEVAAIIPYLTQLSPYGLTALKEFLKTDPQQAEELLLSLSEMDMDLLKRIHSLDRSDRLLLFALANDDKLELKE